ncbi:BMP family ABC transporter substrate-binding protein [Leifsonia sp. 71-9]|mgnify:CR=1 FL=1|uniref:BMP family lipoprotein n=1 Tax=Leifsonia sp. 71-9 TaxID=1895934 RepID=UPI0009284AA7|nr:BMP family ABC transporter substrate-binding protein [Leifsonia sp. 71-9]OJX78952.1 MAG: BMP family ABC transporter substrate-binding protein [Leifsonia sp. 71-9]
MTITARKTALTGLLAAGVVALLAACGSAPSSTSSAGAGSKYLPCIVSDQGGFNDRSFNQLGLEGVQEAAKKIGSSYKQVQSKSANDYLPNIKSLIQQGCNIIVASGFNLVAPVKEAAAANPKVNFVMVDDNSIKADNVKPVVFNTDEAGFLAGYASASYSKTGTIGTYGGQKLPSVTIFMDGIADGVKYYNDQKGTDKKVIGWDVASQDGQFVNSFVDLNTSKTIAQTMLDQNADVLAPIGGPIYQGAASAIKDGGKDVALIGNDADVFLTDQNGYNSMFLTSIMKNIKPTVSTIVEQAASGGKFDNTQYVGNLKNDGVGVAPFHDFASKVDKGLQGELDKIKAGIIDGSIKVTSPSAFTE